MPDSMKITPPKPPEGKPVGRYVSDLLQRVATRDRASDFAKTMALVISLTLLIWVYAERAQSTEEKTTLVLDLASPNPEQIALPLHADDVNRVIVTLDGPRSRIDALKTEIARLSREGKLRLEVPAGLSTGREHDVNVATMAMANRPFIDSGVSVKVSEPENVTIRIDAIETREVPVQLPREAAASVTSQRFEPATVRVRGPVSVLQRVLGRPEGLVAVADLSSTNWQAPGSKTLDAVPLLPPAGEPLLSFAPTTVKVSMDVNPLERQYTIQSMPISVQKPLSMDARYRVEVTPLVLQNVPVVGPPDTIELIRTDRITPRPTAVLVVTNDDLGKDGRHAVRYDLPPGVRAVRAPLEVDFRIVDLTNDP